MNFDIDKFSPSPNNWFEANIEYNGRGRAEFLDPKGTIEGNAKINFDEFGKKGCVRTLLNWYPESH
jgi:hypothetical protein